MKLDAKYDQFIGTVVHVEESTYERNGETYPHYDIDDDQEALKGLFVEAVKNSYKTRVWLPNRLGTCDYRLDRLNVHIEKQKDGTWTIASLSLG